MRQYFLRGERKEEEEKEREGERKKCVKVGKGMHIIEKERIQCT